MTDATTNTLDNGPVPAFFVAGTVVTAAEGVVSVVAITVIAGVAGRVSIVE